MIRETSEKVDLIRRRIKTAQDRQKSYADKRRTDLEFEVGDRIFLKVSPLRNVVRFGSTGKLAPRFVGPFPIIEKVGKMAYRLELPENWPEFTTSFMFLTSGSVCMSLRKWWNLAF